MDSEKEVIVISKRSSELIVQDNIRFSTSCVEIDDDEQCDKEKAVDGTYKVCKVRHYVKCPSWHHAVGNENDPIRIASFDEHETLQCDENEIVVLFGWFYLIHHDSCDPRLLIDHILTYCLEKNELKGDSEPEEESDSEPEEESDSEPEEESDSEPEEESDSEPEEESDSEPEEEIERQVRASMKLDKKKCAVQSDSRTRMHYETGICCECDNFPAHGVFFASGENKMTIRDPCLDFINESASDWIWFRMTCSETGLTYAWIMARDHGYMHPSLKNVSPISRFQFSSSLKELSKKTLLTAVREKVGKLATIIPTQMINFLKE